MTNNQPGDKFNPKIQQELLNDLIVAGNLTLGNITQQNITQNITLNFQAVAPDQQQQIIDLIRKYIDVFKVIADGRYTS